MNLQFSDTSFIFLGNRKPAEGALLSLAVPTGFNTRRIYAFFDTVSAKTNPITLEGEIQFFRNGLTVGAIPFFSVGGNGGPSGIGGNRPILTLVAGGGNIQSNSSILTLPLLTDTGLAQVPLQPSEIQADADKVVLTVKKFTDGAGIYGGSVGYLACLSYR